MNQRPSLRTIALAVTTLLLPLTLLVAQSVGLYLKSNNPDNVDITQGLAYLGPIVLSGWLTFGLLAAIVVALIVAMYRRDGNFAEAKLPLVLLIAVLMIVGSWLVVNNYTDTVQNNYQPTSESRSS